MRHGRLVGVLASALVVGACSSGGAEAEFASATSLKPYYQQEIDWSSCRDGFECGRLTVPLDYDRPGWRQIELAVVRLPAGDKEAREGSLVLNPGGPGGSGISYARAAESVVAPEVRRRFDVVGFDPRGVGQSTPVQCLPDRKLDEYVAMDVSPDGPEERRQLVSASRGYAEGCKKRSGRLLPHVGTANAARDMDVLRAALGDEKLTYLGKSYGTELGAYYAELFPGHVRALVLDGAVDVELSPRKANLTQAQGFETALRAFVSSCVDQPGCPLGDSGVKAGIAELEDFFAGLDGKPLPTQEGGRRLTQAAAKYGLASALYDKQYWPLLRQSIAAAFAGDGTGLLRLSDALAGRQPDGTYTNLMEANMAINCVDQERPEDVPAYADAARKANRAAPHFGEFVAWGSLPCAFWAAEPEESRKLDGAGAAPILVIGTTRDPATPYAWAEALAEQLDSAVLLTREGDGHTAYRVGNACIDRTVNRYLIEGEPPKPGKSC